MLNLLFIFVSFIANSTEVTPPFEKWIDSKNIKISCIGDINDHLIFSIKAFDLNQVHQFLVMRGLDAQSCLNMRDKVKKIQSINNKILLSGFAGTYDESGKVLIHQWKLVKGKNACVSFWDNDCP